MRERDCVVLMARQPVPGAAKTRLAVTLGDGAAARLAAAFLEDTVAMCRNADSALLLSYTPATSGARAYMRRVAPEAVLVPQREGPFGARLAAAMRAGFDLGCARVALLAADAPHLPARAVVRAFVALDQHDAAIGPTRDGGYYILALRAPQPRLFEGIAWSSGRECAQTLERASMLGLRTARLPESFDIDREDDLLALRAHIARRGAAACARTAAALASLARLTGGAS